MDIVEQQRLHPTVSLAPGVETPALHRVHVLIHELLSGQAGDGRFQLRCETVPDGVQQMRLAQPDTAVEKQRGWFFTGW